MSQGPVKRVEIIPDKKEVEEQFSQYENYTPYQLEDVFKYQFKDLPEDLQQQQIEYEKFLNWEKTLI